MEYRQLEKHLQALAGVDGSDSPLISCYLDLSDPAKAAQDELHTRLQLLRAGLPSQSIVDFDEAAARIHEFLRGDVAPRTRGVAAFSRGGSEPLWTALQFEVPLPTWIVAGSTPDIYPLVELKDNYDRYVVLLATDASARILGVNLGSVTAQLWSSRPELRRRNGHEWTRQHLQDHRRERARQFIHDQIQSLDRVVAAGGYQHLILAGSSRMASAVRKQLPKRLAEKLIDSVPAAATDRLPDIVASTLDTFLEHEEMESQALAEKLATQIHTHGLAVAGTRASLNAVKAGQAEVLIIANGYDLGCGWQCRDCGRMELALPKPTACPGCRTGRPRQFDIRGELARLAEQQQIAVEVVEHSDTLMNLGGVGCMLRYFAPAHYLSPAA